MTYTTRIKVRGYHCDYYGHVNNARYLEMLEEARWSMLEQDLDLDYWQQRGMAFVVASVTINYRFPAGPGTDLDIHSGFKRLGGKSGIIHQDVVDAATGQAIADADITFVVVDMKTGKPVAFAGEVLAGFNLVLNGKTGKEEQP